ncbi:hypothetical protein KZX46_22160 (plasmid) [Polymorphobacter sp. PAMC 29334]|nr:hypothetical protein [Polymorphobacter sp. PAMC 29334]QYE37098.1 hypothetical protein KZX46_22160 [Polymorphobacter sp. PAMC 29334]
MSRQRYDRATENEGETAAEIDGGRVSSDRSCALCWGETVRDERIRRGEKDGLADRHPDPGEEEDQKRLGEAAEQSHQTPKRDTCGSEADSMHRVDHPTDRERKRREEDRKRRSDKQADLYVVHVQIVLDRVDQQTDDLAVDEREHVGQHENGDHRPRLPCRRVGPALAIGGIGGRGGSKHGISVDQVPASGPCYESGRWRR